MLIEISEPSQAGEARRKAVAYAEDLHIDDRQHGKIALATTEMATNLVKHAGRGYILLQPLYGFSGLRITSVDKGPGISDIAKAISDGHSTAGSMGAGLGAIQRLSDFFDLYSTPAGTVVCAEFRQGENGHQFANARIEIGIVSEPIPGENVCGDGWGLRPLSDGAFLMVVDGLGHGILAAEAAREAERILSTTQGTGPCEIINETHAALKKTRGAAFGISRLNIEKGLLAFAGVGNISASLVAPGSSRSLPSHNGILGENAARVQEFTYPWNQNNILVMHSDGLGTRWDLDRYPGIWNKPPSLIAAVLHRDFARGRDDVTVLVAKAA